MTLLPPGLHGAHLRTELAGHLGPNALRSALREGRLVTYSRAVVVDPRRATDFATRAAAALLTVGPQAVLAGHSALAAHGCEAADTAPIHLLVPYERKPYRRDGVVTHQGRIDEEDLDEVAGLRVLALDVALAEVLSRGSRRAGLACADQALRSVPEDQREGLRCWVEQRIHLRDDPRGRRQAFSLVNLASGLAESPAESWILLVLVDGGLPVPEQQFPITDHAGKELYRLDFAWPQVRVAVEYDGYIWHESRREADAAREADLRRRGWIVIRADADDLKNPYRLPAAVEDAFRRRGLLGKGDSRAWKGDSRTRRGDSRG